MKKNLLILTALFTAVIGYSQTFTEANITYTVTSTTNNTVRTQDYNTAGGANVTIPSTVIDASTSITYTVTEIGSSSFDTNNLTSVIIPTSVTNIGEYAFNQNQNLTSAPLHNGITSIGQSAFFLCDLTNVNIPTSMTSIEVAAFANNNIVSLTIPDNITSIGDRAFRDNQLTSVTIPSNVTSIGQSAFYSNPLTCVISEAATPPIIATFTLATLYFDSFFNRSNIDLSIPTGTASAYAAAQWTGFNSVAEGLTGTFVVDNITYQILPTTNNEVTITDYNTAGGTVVNIPATVTSGCTVFSVTDIGLQAFQTNNLTSITIPDSVISIGENAFAWNNLQNLIIPDSVLTIGEGAFAQNNNLNNVVIGNSVTSIGELAFIYDDLTSITIPDSVTDIGSYAFSSNNLSTIVLGNNVETIGIDTFRYNQLTIVIIPNSVTNIGSNAFSANPSLTDVFSESTTPPTIITGTNDTFTSISTRGNIHLHIPAGTMGAYVTDAGALWTGFNPVSEDALSTTDFELTNDVKVFTTTDAIKITSSNHVTLQNYTLYSITGAKIATGTASEIATSTLSSGIYILKLDFDSGTVVKKVAIN